MKPSYEELLSGATTWRFPHKTGLIYELSFHGYVPLEKRIFADSGEGTWCYYLIVPEQMFPHRWDDFRCLISDHGFHQPTPTWERVDFDGGITFSETRTHWSRKEGRFTESVKVGCDYNHLWNAEMGYPDTFASVKVDAESAVRRFLQQNPDHKARSGYSHVWGDPDEFYTAINGELVHREKDDIPDGWDGWKEAK